MNASHNSRFLDLLCTSARGSSEGGPAELQLMKANPTHPWLHFKKVRKLWSARIGLNHRALAVEDGQDIIWAWIGSHDEYTRMIKKQG